jgi:LysM repeat protein
MLKRRKAPPTNGYEIIYDDQPWLSLGKNSNNCYAYAVNDFDFFRIQKSTPGDTTGKNNNHLPPYYTPAGLRKRILMDNPKKVYSAGACEKCKPKFYKMMMFIARRGKTKYTFDDFHFYKQHSEVRYRVQPGDTLTKIARFFAVPVSRVSAAAAGRLVPGTKIQFKADCFSHKQGYGGGPLLVDAKGKPIRDARCADKNYGYLNYSTYGGSFCVKNRGIKVGNTYS